MNARRSRIGAMPRWIGFRDSQNQGYQEPSQRQQVVEVNDSGQAQSESKANHKPTIQDKK